MVELRTMSNEIFDELIKEDKWISEIARAATCYDKFCNFSHYKTVSYPVEYKVSVEQIEKAKVEYERRKQEVIQSISNGVLAFRAMGGDFTSNIENSIKNYRIRGYFQNNEGHKYFLELLGNSSRVFCDFSIDCELEEQRKKEYDDEAEERKRVHGTYPIKEMQDYYNAFGIEKERIDCEYTFDGVIEFVNKTFGCSYKKMILVNYFANCEDWCCTCNSEK